MIITSYIESLSATARKYSANRHHASAFFPVAMPDATWLSGQLARRAGSAALRIN